VPSEVQEERAAQDLVWELECRALGLALRVRGSDRTPRYLEEWLARVLQVLASTFSRERMIARA
jgi:hypothetical protein